MCRLAKLQQMADLYIEATVLHMSHLVQMQSTVCTKLVSTAN